MNELEEVNLHEHLVRKSVAVLLFKGAVVWFFFLLAEFFWNYLSPQVASETFLAGNILESTPGYTPFVPWIIKAIFGLILLMVVLRWVYEYYIFKIDRIILRRGVIFSREEVYDIENIHAVDVVQGLLGKILDTGTLKVRYGARGIEKSILFTHIPRPYHVASTLKHPPSPLPR